MLSTIFSFEEFVSVMWDGQLQSKRGKSEFFDNNSVGLITAFRFLFRTRNVYFNLCWQQTGERMKVNKYSYLLLFQDFQKWNVKPSKVNYANENPPSNLWNFKQISHLELFTSSLFSASRFSFMCGCLYKQTSKSYTGKYPGAAHCNVEPSAWLKWCSHPALKKPW